MTYIQPVYPLLTLFTLLALAWHWRRSPARPWLLVTAIALQCLFAIPLVAWMGSWTLERDYAVSATPTAEGSEAIVVLGGVLYGPRPERPAVLLGSDTYIRAQHAAWLFKNWEQLPVLVCGGEVTSAPGAPPLAEAMRDSLEKEGVPSEMIWCETRSTSTYENALYAAELLRERGIDRIALVTEAFHMYRAERCFRKQGIEVVPAPCGFRSGAFTIERRFPQGEIT